MIFKTISWSLEHFFLTLGQNNFGNKIPLFSRFEVMVTFVSDIILSTPYAALIRINTVLTTVKNIRSALKIHFGILLKQIVTLFAQ